MPRPDEGLLHAWLDGQLPPGEAARVEQLAATDPEWAAAVAEARGLVAASSRILSALDHVPSGVIPQRASMRAPRRLPWWTKVAAAVVVVAGMSSAVLHRTSAPVIASEDATQPAAPPAATKQVATAPVVQAPAPQAPAPTTVKAGNVPRTANAPRTTAEQTANAASPSSVTEGVANAKTLAERRDATDATSARTMAAEMSAKDRAVASPQPTAAGAPTPAAPQLARAPASEVVGGVAAPARKGTAVPAAACYRLQEAGPPTTQMIVMRHVRTDGDTLRLAPIDARSPSPVSAWLVLRDGTAHGAMKLVPDSKGAVVPVVATPAPCPVP